MTALNSLRIWPLVLGLAVLMPACWQAAVENSVCHQGLCVEVELAQTPAQRQRGLQFRKTLPEGRGMLFIFPREDRYSFWMKDTFIPLDMIWIDRGRRVVHIERQVPPCSSDPCPTYVPPGAAIYVLEVNAGGADRLGLAPGIELDFYLAAVPEVR